MTRQALIAKLRPLLDRALYLKAAQSHSAVPVGLDCAELERIIADLEFADFAHKSLEGLLPDCLQKQAG